MKKLFFLSLAALSSATLAHNLFPAQTADGYTLKFWADDHWETPKPHNVISLHAYNQGKAVKIGYNYESGKISTKSKDEAIDAMTAEYNFGYFTFTDKAYFHKPRTEVKGAIFDTRRIYKLGKTIFSWNDAYTQPLGMKIEVTPQQNPLLLKVGDKLKVRVTLNGKPFAGATFEDQVGDLDGVTTDAQGQAEITLRKPEDGYEILGATARLPYQLENTQAETLQLTGTLAFKPKN